MGRASVCDGGRDRGASGDIPTNPSTEQRIDDLRSYLDNKFDTIDRRFRTMQAQLDRRFDAVEGRIDTVDEQVGKLGIVG